MGFFDSVLSFGLNSYLQNEQNKSNQWAVNSANLYNSPVEQMKRFASAGLNPNLIYGQVNNTPAQYVDYGRVNANIESPLTDVLQYKEVKNRDAQNTLLGVQTALGKQQTNESIGRQALNVAQINKLISEKDGQDLDNRSKAYELALAQASGMSSKDPFYARFGGRLVNWLKNFSNSFDVSGYDTVDGKIINRERR